MEVFRFRASMVTWMHVRGYVIGVEAVACCGKCVNIRVHSDMSSSGYLRDRRDLEHVSVTCIGEYIQYSQHARNPSGRCVQEGEDDGFVVPRHEDGCQTSVCDQSTHALLSITISVIDYGA